MTTLAERQREFLGAIFGAEEPGPPASIYRRNVLANLGGALAATYPVVARLVGDAFFAEAARRYALGHASTSGDLGEYGAAFAQFLARYEHARALGYLADVARLEWACHESLNAPDAAAFDFAALACVAPEHYGELRFRVHPSVRTLRSPHAIASIWLANQPGRDGAVANVDREEQVIVRRHDGRQVVEAVDADTWRLVDALGAGAALAHAARGESIAAALRRLVAGRIVVGFDRISAA